MFSLQLNQTKLNWLVILHNVSRNPDARLTYPGLVFGPAVVNNALRIFCYKSYKIGP